LHSEPFDSAFAKSIYEARYKKDDDRNWLGTTDRVINSVTGELFKAPRAQQHKQLILDTQERLRGLMGRMYFVPGGRYLYASGRDLHQVNNCVLLRAEDSREGWADLASKSAMALMTGAGIGVWYGDIRAAGTYITRTGGTASGPLPLAELVNDQGGCYLQGGNRRSAIWAGFPWWHPDVFSFILSKDWSPKLRQERQEWYENPGLESRQIGRHTYLDSQPEPHAPMSKTNISVTLDDDFFRAYNSNPYDTDLEVQGKAQAPNNETWDSWAKRVYETALTLMLRNGEPGFTVDVLDKSGEVLRNACTEITSADDSDVCNLGSLVLPRFDTPQEFGAAVRDATMFLTAGTEYSDVPYDKVAEVREQNRRLGLGLIGVHEFLMKRGVKYGTDEAFEVMEPYMEEYGRALEYANDQQDIFGYSLSVGATAFAPNGTIGAISDSTPSGDPMFSAAEIRRVVNASPSGDVHEQHVVVDPSAARLVKEGVNADLIEDAHTLSLQPERRLAQQAFMQRYTDHAISSTVNIAAQITELTEIEDFGDTLMKFLPELRGVTVYPDGAIAGQPRTPVDLKWALDNVGTVLEGNEEACIGGLCGV
jgi:ribonucleoside-diphosphate reductase alpha chain